MDTGRKAFILSPLWEHFAISVFLVSLFLVIPKSKNSFLRIACYVRLCFTALNVLIIFKDIFPTILIKIHLNAEPSSHAYTVFNPDNPTTNAAS